MFEETIQQLKQRIESIRSKKDLDSLRSSKEELEKKSNETDFWSDNEEAQKIMRKLGDIKSEIDEFQNLEKRLNDVESLLSESTEEDSEITEMINIELKELEKQVNESEMKTFLSGKFDKNDTIVKIVAGQGGTEACDWAEMVFRMYLRYANSKGWKVSVIDEVKGTEAGIASIAFEIYGLYSYGYLKREYGTHRLVRNSPFNAQGLRQTSFAGVEVLPIVNEDIDIEINPNDLEFSAVRSSGAGGQNVNKVASKVRIVHKPTGLVVESSAQRSQSQNREVALRTLKAKLYEIEEDKKNKELKQIKGDYQIAGWGTQIRNYVLQPYKLVKDTRTDVETSNTDAVLDGDIQMFIDAEIRML
jgi:peptide chain release factor 2